ncbi:hypothetical protein ACHQM5_009506 [Ranunculus cassubicifolius]
MTVLSMCRICKSHLETLDHLIWGCKLARDIWKWISTVFKLNTGVRLRVLSEDEAHRFNCYVEQQ